MIQNNKTAPYKYKEKLVDLGEIKMNYIVAGADVSPALLLIPGQTESWWGFEAAIEKLESNFQVFAIDLRGQGKSTQTPGRYSLNLMGNDLVRFISLVIKRPVIVSGNSSGGLLAAWLSAYAMPNQIRAIHCEDAPFFTAEKAPLYGHAIQQAAGPIFSLMSKFLGDQWSINNWEGLKAAQAKDTHPANKMISQVEQPPQHLKEYDPEWGRAFIEGKFNLNSPHHTLLSDIKTPMLYTHHMRFEDPQTGLLIGATSDFQASKIKEIALKTGNSFELIDAPDAFHSMHEADPQRFVDILTSWIERLNLQ
ncbi:alpha/beta hydrolase [Hirschia baltica]|uniref:Alpha/beta hydrolase fold protein n=1 Tax=Hirschia baltica (strain ATCC 49814 / DSM 5838 / IFAM 1418) TaxID=582402 RepID=C6XP75_HIRBI|nr:alpha/beta hydrolase [Hirschia baltica]ACT60255.1 alpha/beta hydrolase fold protein [Hirschia baltica ATCC 49814]